MLKSKHYEMIGLYISGHTSSDISRITGMSVKTIYNWLNDEEIQKEIQRITKDTQTSTQRYIDHRLKTYIDKLEAIALDEDTSVKVRGDLLKYLVNRVMGNTTVKNEVSIKEDTTGKIDMDALEKELSKVNEEDEE